MIGAGSCGKEIMKNAIEIIVSVNSVLDNLYLKHLKAQARQGNLRK